MSGIIFFLICVCALSLYSMNHKMSTGTHAALILIALAISFQIGSSAG